MQDNLGRIKVTPRQELVRIQGLATDVYLPLEAVAELAYGLLGALGKSGKSALTLGDLCTLSHLTVLSIESMTTAVEKLRENDSINTEILAEDIASRQNHITNRYALLERVGAEIARLREAEAAEVEDGE